jgi:hypothetical protein
VRTLSPARGLQTLEVALGIHHSDLRVQGEVPLGEGIPCATSAPVSDEVKEWRRLARYISDQGSVAPKEVFPDLMERLRQLASEIQDATLDTSHMILPTGRKSFWSKNGMVAQPAFSKTYGQVNAERDRKAKRAKREAAEAAASFDNLLVRVAALPDERGHAEGSTRIEDLPSNTGYHRKGLSFNPNAINTLVMEGVTKGHVLQARSLDPAAILPPSEKSKPAMKRVRQESNE